MTNSGEPEAVSAKQYFERLLRNLPAPVLDTDGAPNELKDPEGKRERRGKRKQRTEN